MSLFHDVFTYFTRYCRVSIVDFELENVCQEPMLRISSTLEQNDVIALLSLFLILNIFHTLFQCLSMYLIAGFDISYFSRFQIKMNSSLIVYSFLERNSTKCNANPLASSSKQVFITNFNANCNVNYFLFSLSFDK